eukprot:5982376-Pyramimonas_sp.AAC.1
MGIFPRWTNQTAGIVHTTAAPRVFCFVFSPSPRQPRRPLSCNTQSCEYRWVVQFCMMICPSPWPRQRESRKRGAALRAHTSLGRDW